MRVKVLFFGMLKDIVGRAEEQLEMPEECRLVGVFDHYATQFPRLREMASSIVLARNHEFADPSVAVRDGDEVALLPPVSGGMLTYLTAQGLSDAQIQLISGHESKKSLEIYQHLSLESVEQACQEAVRLVGI